MSHVVVIGAGSIGLHAAYHLRARGYNVTVIERMGEIRDGASFGNAGIVVPSHFVPLAAPGIVWKGLRWMADPTSPFYVKPRPSLDLVAWGIRFWLAANERHVRRSSPSLLALNLQSRMLWDDLVRELNAPVAFTTRGLLMLCHTEAGLEAEAHLANLATELGLQADVLNASEVRALEPDIDLDVVGAVRFPDDAHLDPRALMQALQAHLLSMGVRFRFGVHALRIRVRGGRAEGVLIRSADGTGAEMLSANHVVLASGSWSAELARDLGLRLLLQPGKGYSLTINDPSQSLRSAAILVEASAAASGIGDRFRIGGTMELAGFDPQENATRIDGIKRAALTYFPSFRRNELDAAAVWHGLRPLSPDGLPYLGSAPSVPNAVVATGHAMMGFSTGPATGRTVAEIIENERSSLDISHFAPDRHT